MIPSIKNRISFFQKSGAFALWLVPCLLVAGTVSLITGCEAPAIPLATTPSPTGVVATAGDGTVTLTWTAVSGATSYTLYWSVSPGVTVASATTIPGVSAPYQHTGLTNGATYYYALSATAPEGISALSQQVFATPQAPANPSSSPPTGVVAAGGDGAVTLKWDAVSGATSYTIYWGAAPGLSVTTSTAIPGVTSPYLHTGLINGTNYFYALTSTGPGGTSGLSTQVVATPRAGGGRPTAPGGITATSGDGAVTLTWNTVIGANDYTVYWGNTAGLNVATATAIPSVTSPYMHTGLTNSTAYFYAITASGPGGTSALSNEVSVTPWAASLPPFAPGGVGATAGDGTVTLIWNVAGGATGYTLYWGTAPGLTLASTSIQGVTSPYLHSGRSNATTYYYALAATGTGGSSSLSAEVSAAPQAGVVLPAAPTGVAATAGDGAVTLTWNAVSGATGYTLYWSNAPGMTVASATPIAGVTNPYNHSGLTNSTIYFYALTATDTNGTSGLSAEITATPELAEVPPVLSVNIVQLAGSYDPATGRLGAMNCTSMYPTDPNDAWCFSGFGVSKANDLSYDYKVAAGSTVYAATAGEVVDIQAETLQIYYPNEFEIHTKSTPTSAYTVIYDHVKNLTVSIGSVVSAGDALGTAGIHTSDPAVWGRVELQLNQTLNPNPVQEVSLCPRSYGTTAFNLENDAALAAHNAANPAFPAASVCLVDRIGP